MAQEIRIERRAAHPDGGRTARREPETTEDARRAIEATRGRISATLDEIEGRIGEAREKITARVNVVRPVRNQLREHPLAGVGIAFGAGLVLGLLTGGEEGREERRRRRGMLEEEEREELRRWRAERRERLRDRGGRREIRSRFGRLAGVVASAAMSGMAVRARRMVSGDSARERA